MIKKLMRAKNKKTIINFSILFLLISLLIYFADLDNLQETMFKPEIVKDQFPKIITQAAKNTIIFIFLKAKTQITRNVASHTNPVAMTDSTRWLLRLDLI